VISGVRALAIGYWEEVSHLRSLRQELLTDQVNDEEKGDETPHSSAPRSSFAVTIM
jgi:hypothetical protein